MKQGFLLGAALAVLSMGPQAAGAADLLVRPAPVVAPAPAFNWAGLYASFHGGVYLPEDANSTFLVGPPSVSGVSESSAGYRVGGALGYDFNQTFGVEIEASYASAAVDQITVEGVGTLPADGDGRVFSIMGNAFIGQSFGRMRLYAGGGAGAAQLSLGLDFPAPLDAGVHDSDWTWAAQGIVGVEFALTRAVTIGGRYRYQFIGPTDFLDGDSDPVAVDGFGSHSAEAVLKIRLGS